MKKILLSLFVFVTISAKSQLLIENFDYTALDTLKNVGWTQTTANTVNQVLVTNPGLTFSGYASSGIGNAATIMNNGQDLYRNLSSNVTSNAVYMAFMFSIDSAKATGDYFLAFLPSTSTTLYGTRLFVKTDGANIVFGISKGAETPIYSSTTFSTNTTYLGVLKYQYNTTTGFDDKSSLFVFNGAIPASEPSALITDTSTTRADYADIGRVALRQGTSSAAPGLKIDGIRVATTWSLAALLPVKLSSFNAVGLQNQVNLNWITASEINSQNFEVERSVDGVNFTSVATVAAKGQSARSTTYQTIDRNLPASNVLYYRIKSVSVSGAFEYSPVQRVSLRNINLSISPNPANSLLYINSNNLVQHAELLDMMGKRVFASQNNKTNSLSIDVSKLPNGNYALKTTIDGVTKVQKIVVSH